MSKKKDFIDVSISPEIQKKIHEFVDAEFGINFQNRPWYNKSITNDNPMYASTTGEIAVEIILGHDVDSELKRRNTGQGDNGIDITLNGYSWDVKTVRCKYYPREYYHFTLTDKDLNHSLTNGFIFTSVFYDESMVVIVGYLYKKEFLVYCKTYEPNEPNELGKSFSYKTYQVTINQMNNPRDLF